MGAEVNTIITSLATVIGALGGYKLIKLIITYRAKSRREDVQDDATTYGIYKKELKSFLETIAELRAQVTDLLRNDSEREKKIIELESKVDQKNQYIFNLSQTTRENTDKIENQAREIVDLKYLKCEREDCDTRIPSRAKKERASA